NIHFHGDALWFLERIHERSLGLGRAADWADPDWPMLDMGGYGSGARYVLGMAIRHDNVALARWALNHGANPDAGPPSDTRSPKHSLYEAAVRAGRSNIAALLLERGATRTEVAIEPENAFMAACFEGDAERAHALVARHPELRESAKAMIAAVKQDHAAVVALLLDLGVSIEIENEHRQRPLHHAAWANSLEVAALLIERGAEIDPVESQWHNTPLDFAVWSQHRGMIDLLVPHSRDIWNVVFTGAVDRLRALLAAEPALARTADTGGETPLMWLPNEEQDAAEIVRLFLEGGADARAVDGGGLTAADHASRRGLREAADLLRAAEAATAVL
ncbi:MAG TPA: ankyrin repeat domain-containing protein, partial [Longimicrobiales bacterium]|nr:ankyrin repeat domain-containing protein [Longimicrobiales bacterium]